MASVPPEVRHQLAPHLRELDRAPIPPFREPSGIAEELAACQAASLLNTGQDGQDRRFFVHRWTATELAARLPSSPQLVEAHRRAAQYWRVAGPRLAPGPGR